MVGKRERDLQEREETTLRERTKNAVPNKKQGGQGEFGLVQITEKVAKHTTMSDCWRWIEREVTLASRRMCRHVRTLMTMTTVALWSPRQGDFGNEITSWKGSRRQQRQWQKSLERETQRGEKARNQIENDFQEKCGTNRQGVHQERKDSLVSR